MDLTVLFRLIQNEKEDDYNFTVSSFIIEKNYIKLTFNTWRKYIGNVSKDFVVAKLSPKNWLVCTDRKGTLVFEHIVESFGVLPTLKQAINYGDAIFDYNY